MLRFPLVLKALPLHPLHKQLEIRAGPIQEQLIREIFELQVQLQGQ